MSFKNDMRFLKRNSTNIARILLLAVFLYLAGLAIWLDFAFDPLSQWVVSSSTPGRLLAHALINVAPELAGIVIGVVTIDYLNERRQDEQLKRQLILQMGSGHNDVTDIAIRTLDAYGWLKDGSLEGANLKGANLQDANLSGAYLKGVKLPMSDLAGVHLEGANLTGSYLMLSNLKKANLNEADLQEADLTLANLEGASLARCCLRKARLTGADLIKLYLKEVDFFNADLERANLREAFLGGANLEETNLVNADLTRAMLEGTNLKGANLTGAILAGANLRSADLTGVKNWEAEQLLEALELSGAIMPDGRKYEEWIKDFRTGENSESI
ncbi:MAG: pentapeptide repeat-containing protein [Anaerolineales bacterium]|nr:pentapeptide repeat-containing protein [Anaerolineales bacterium]